MKFSNTILWLLLGMTLVSKTVAQTSQLDSLIQRVQKSANDTSRILSMSALSQKYMESDPEMAQTYADSVKILSEIIKYKKGLGLYHSLSGLIQLLYSNYDKALQHQLTALDIRRSIQDQIGIIKSLNNIGNVYRELKQYDQAIEYHRESIELARQNNNTKEVANAMNNIGNAMILKGELNSAIMWFDSSYVMLKEIKDYTGMAAITGNIGAVHYYNRDTVQAFKYFKESLMLREQLNDLFGIISAQINFGQINLDIGNISEALKYFNVALKKAEELNLKERIQLCYLGLSDTYAKAGQFEKAFQYNRKYVMYRDTLMNEDMNRKISEMQAKYDTEIKDKEIELLSSENKLRTSELTREKNLKYAYMAAAIGLPVILIMGMVNLQSRRKRREADFSRRLVVTEMKALRSQMNPHFIFNSLQSIQSFLLHHKNDDANEYLIKFAGLIRKVLENSMHQEITLRDELEALELFMQLERLRLKYPFSYEIDIPDGINSEEIFVPPLILQPFVENSIWHGFQHKDGPGHLWIRIQKENDSLHILIEDDGVGYSSDKPETAVHRLPKKESLGMKLTEERLRIVNELRKVRSWFEISDRPGQGTMVKISLPD